MGSGGVKSTAQGGEDRQGGNLHRDNPIKDVDDFETLSLTGLIQKLTDDIRRQERQLQELERRGRISMVSAGVALVLSLISSAIGSAATYVTLLWLTLAAAAALVAYLAHKRRVLIIDLIGQNRWFRSIVIEEAYTGKDIGPKI